VRTPAVGRVTLGELLEPPPRHRLAEVVQERILVVHGRVPHVLSQHMVLKVETSTKPGHAPPYRIAKPDSRGLDPGIHSQGRCWLQHGLPGQARQ
jgi:hypothetical protein